MLRVVKSIADMNAAIVAHLERVPRNVEAVVGIPRSGWLAASSIALHLQLPLADLNGFAVDGRAYRRSMSRVLDAPRRVLLVDDTVLHGTAMAKAVATLRAAAPRVKIVRLAIYDSPVTPDGAVDIALERVPGPRAFAWNLWKHKRLPRWCFDLDGVLCRDPLREENDDGPRYLEFIRTATPKFRPTRPIGHIVTARLEKYRAETEGWLQRQGIEHAGLIMMNLPDKAARMRQGNRSGYKAAAFESLGTKVAELFIESDERQAHKIARISGKAVWCTDAQRFYPGTTILAPDNVLDVLDLEA